MARDSLAFRFEVVKHYFKERAGYKNNAKYFGIRFGAVR